MVATRQCATSLGGEFFPAKPGALISYTPSTVFVLPTSRTRSICTSRSRTYASGDNNAQALVGTNAEKATGIQPVRHAAVASVFFYMHRFAVRVRGPCFHALDDRFIAQVRRSHRPRNST